MGDDEKEDAGEGITKMITLIRANLHVDPTAGSVEDFAADYAAALWLEEWRLMRQAKMITKLFSNDQNGGRG